MYYIRFSQKIELDLYSIYISNTTTTTTMNIENDKLYKSLMQEIEDEWYAWKDNNMWGRDDEDIEDILEDFRMDTANQENSIEEFDIEFENMEHLMLYQRWCSNTMDELGVEDQKVLYDMRTLKQQVLYWVCYDFCPHCL